MPPIEEYAGWNKRTSDSLDEITPYKRYFVICEGENTEVFYFKSLINNRRDIGINSNIELILLEKTGEDRSVSAPKRLVKYANKYRSDNDLEASQDKIIIVFDYDAFQNKVQNYYPQLFKDKNTDDLLAVSNPCFELFLLLHLDINLNDLENDKENILKNENDYVAKLFSSKTNMNPKSNKNIGMLALRLNKEIENEKLINQDIDSIQDKLTCNLGKIISEIIDKKEDK